MEQKMSALRRHLRRWASHTDGSYKQQKSSLQNMITELDIAAETRALTESEHDDMIHARNN
jgi:GH35 family endo-1,4-beta-xylanase